MSDEGTYDAPRLSDADKSYYLRRAAAESSTAARAGNTVAAEIHAILALAYLRRVLGRRLEIMEGAGPGGGCRSSCP